MSEPSTTNTEPTEFLMHGVARAVARGKTISSSAKNWDVSVAVARTWADLPEFRQLVNEYRTEICDRMSGKLASTSSRAIDRLIELSEHSGMTAVSVSATRGLMKPGAMSRSSSSCRKMSTQ